MASLADAVLYGAEVLLSVFALIVKVRNTARIRIDAIKYHTCARIPNGKVTKSQ